MKNLYLVTTFTDSPEHVLLGEAAEKLGYKFKLINLSELTVFLTARYLEIQK